MWEGSVEGVAQEEGRGGGEEWRKEGCLGVEVGGSGRFSYCRGDRR